MSNTATTIDNLSMQAFRKNSGMIFWRNSRAGTVDCTHAWKFWPANRGTRSKREGRSFDGVSADIRDGEHNIWMSFGSTSSSDNLTHGVHGAVNLYVMNASAGNGEVLAAESEDGTKTLLLMSNQASRITSL